jgi:hypothetical protein
MQLPLILATTVICFFSISAFPQSTKAALTYTEPILTDSSSTLFFPIQYNDVFDSENKVAFLTDYYANIIAYDFKKDTYKALFPQNTFIEAFQLVQRSDNTPERRYRNIYKNLVILSVKTTDTNANGRIDSHDPSFLYVVNTNGENLKLLTSKQESVVDFQVFEKQGIAVVRMQHDTNNDGSFRKEDKRTYFRTLNLTTVTIGREIE